MSMEALLFPFQFEFMRNALIISVLVAVPAALLSCFLVLKGWSLMGDAVSHAVLPGVVIAYMVKIPLGVGAFAAAARHQQHQGGTHGTRSDLHTVFPHPFLAPFEPLEYPRGVWYTGVKHVVRPRGTPWNPPLSPSRA